MDDRVLRVHFNFPVPDIYIVM